METLLTVLHLAILGLVLVVYTALGLVMLGDSRRYYRPARQNAKIKYTSWQIFATCLLFVAYVAYAKFTTPHLAATIAIGPVAHASIVWTMIVNHWVRKDRPGHIGALAGILLVLWSYPMTKLGAVEASWMAAVFVVVGLTCMVIGLRRYDYEG